MPAISLQACVEQHRKIVFDSSVLIAARRDPGGTAMARVIAIPPALRYAGTVALVELVHVHSIPKDERHLMMKWLRNHQIKHLPAREATDACALSLLRRERFEPCDDKPLDLFHAALALDHKAGLATLNRKHFEFIPGVWLVSDFGA
jgi:predicted nucleic acid-binding protein